MRYIAGLDLLRFLGAISVVFLHLGLERQFGTLGIERYYVLCSGNTGIILFYVVSGFLISSILLHEIDKHGTFNIRGFYLRRTLRIFPLYYLAILFYFLAGVLGVQRGTETSFAYALTYSYNFIPRESYDSWFGSFHTLATEEHFYLLYPVLIAGSLKLRIPVWIIPSILIFLTLVTRVLSRPLDDVYFVNRWTFNAWAPILVGCLFAQIHRARSGADEGRLYFFGAFLILFLSQALVPESLTLAVAFGFLVLHFASNQDRPGIRRLGASPIRFLGAISYGIYVWQSFLISTGSTRSLVSNPILAIGLVLALSVLSWHFIERPIAALRGRIRTGQYRDSGTPDGDRGRPMPRGID